MTLDVDSCLSKNESEVFSCTSHVVNGSEAVCGKRKGSSDISSLLLNGNHKKRQSSKLKQDNNINFVEVTIPALLTEGELRRFCAEQGLMYNGEKVSDGDGRRSYDFGSESRDEDIYEVERILDEKTEKGIHYYKVEWRNFPLSEATWEPQENLTDCHDAIETFAREKMMQNLQSKPFDRSIVERFIKRIARKRDPDIPSMMKIYSIQGKSIPFPRDSSEVEKLRNEVHSILNYGVKRLMSMRNNIYSVMAFAEERAKCLKELKAWEEHINQVNPERPRIRVTNGVDCEGPPTDFKFIDEYIHVGIPMRSDPLLGCSCSLCDENSACCPVLASESFPYDKRGRLKLEPGNPICECNSRCLCGPDCLNRIVQKGRQVKLEIYRTSNGRGWGVKALQPIKRGQFVVEYIGEIITSEEAEQRRYDDDDDSYLFDLDFDEDFAYTVDAKHYGNVAHFINHSCDPNMHVFAVWINHLDPKLPRLAFFAKKDIKVGEELTFDYMMDRCRKENSSDQTASSPVSTPKKDATHCNGIAAAFAEEAVAPNGTCSQSTPHKHKLNVNSIVSSAIDEPISPKRYCPDTQAKKSPFRSLKDWLTGADQGRTPASKELPASSKAQPLQRCISTPKKDSQNSRSRTEESPGCMKRCVCLCGAENCRGYLF